MEGERWQGLMQAAKEFANTKKVNSAVTHLASCVVFASTANTVFSNQPLESTLFDNIPFPSGGTSFSAAIAEVLKLAKLAASGNPIVIVFMSDGEAYYPEDGMQELVQLRDKIESFWTVGFGDHSAVLQQMVETTKFPGKYLNPKTVTGLIDTYAEIAYSV